MAGPAPVEAEDELIDSCLIFVPFSHDDEPEILRCKTTSVCPISADGEHSSPPETPGHGPAHTRYVEAGARLEAWLRDAARHWQRYDVIYRRAHALDVDPGTLSPYRDWLERNERLLRAGRAIFDDPGTYGVHLDRMENGRHHLRSAVSRMESFSAESRAQSRSRDRGPTQSL